MTLEKKVTEEILTAEECREGWRLSEDGHLVFLYRGEKLKALFSRPAVTKWRIREVIDHERGLPARVSWR